MAGFIYVNKETGYFAKISAVELSDPALIAVPKLPPDTTYRWSSNTWVQMSDSEAVLATGNETEKAIAQLLDPETGTTATTEETKQLGVLPFNNLNELTLGNNVADWDNLDILYYKNVAPLSKNNGIYTKSKGYLAFPALAWDSRSKVKTTSFIWYCSSDSRYFVFGLASKERFNWRSNDYQKCEIGVRFRNYRGAYYQYGLTENNKNTYSFKGYEGFESNGFYRLDLENNGAKEESAKLYRLIGKVGSVASLFSRSL
ncbi:MAG: hypothetical protein QNJ72_31335 [Pleurocapsa sp. MO_226.B13]|nr:hypothetical protein [Pleurocapsa sp. MO_226.B13]